MMIQIASVKRPDRREMGRKVRRTARGDELTRTTPVLTRLGWHAAGTLAEGDEVICNVGEAEAPLVDPNGVEMPSLIEAVAGALAKLRGAVVIRVPTTAEDFHGDGVLDGDVDAVAAARLLVDKRYVPVTQKLNESKLVRAAMPTLHEISFDVRLHNHPQPVQVDITPQHRGNAGGPAAVMLDTEPSRGTLTPEEYRSSRRSSWRQVPIGCPSLFFVRGTMDDLHLAEQTATVTAMSKEGRVLSQARAFASASMRRSLTDVTRGCSSLNVAARDRPACLRQLRRGHRLQQHLHHRSHGALGKLFLRGRAEGLLERAHRAPVDDVLRSPELSTCAMKRPCSSR